MRYIVYKYQYQHISNYGSSLTLKVFNSAFDRIHRRYFDDPQYAFSVIKQEGDIFVQQCLSYSFTSASSLLIISLASLVLLVCSKFVEKIIIIKQMKAVLNSVKVCSNTKKDRNFE